MIELIAAISNGNVIGYKGKMPWGRLPLDLAHFKEITDRQTIVIGFNTLLSIGKELPGRKVLVLTHNPAKLMSFPWCGAVTDVDDILTMAETKRIIIAGGEVFYREFLPFATIAHITRIQATFEGDAYFPQLPHSDWRMRHSEFHKADKGKRNDYSLTFETWVNRYHEEERMAA